VVQGPVARAGYVLLASAGLAFAGGIAALVSLVVILGDAGDLGRLPGVSALVLALALLPPACIQAVLAWPATHGRAPWQAASAGVIGALAYLAALPLSLSSWLVAVVLVGIGINAWATITAARYAWSDRRAARADLVRASGAAALKALGAGALGGGVVFLVYGLMEASGQGFSGAASSSSLALGGLVLAFGTIELVLGVRTESLVQRQNLLIGGGLAILAGLAAWFAASRPGIEAIVALSAGAFVLASGIPEPPAMDRRP